jgi:signal transduction histidine kinase
VRDNGPGLVQPAGDGEAAESQGIGLRNTRARLASLYGTAQQFSLESAEGGGLVAHLVLPFHTDTDLYTTSLPNERPARGSAPRRWGPDWDKQ